MSKKTKSNSRNCSHRAAKKNVTDKCEFVSNKSGAYRWLDLFGTLVRVWSLLESLMKDFPN